MYMRGFPQEKIDVKLAYIYWGCKKIYFLRWGRRTKKFEKPWLKAPRSISIYLFLFLLTINSKLLSQTLFGNPKGPVELGNPNTCAKTKLCLNFILFRLKK